METRLDRSYLIQQCGPKLGELTSVDLSYKKVLGKEADSRLYECLNTQGFGFIVNSIIANNKNSRLWRPFIAKIDANTFLDCSNLKIINLKNNHITSIGSQTFAGLSKLEYLSLKSNEIVEIETSSFQGLVNLKSLDLSLNKLEKIESKMFDPLRNLEILLLHNNFISTVDSNAFEGLNNDTGMKAITLYENKSSYKSFVRDNYIKDLGELTSRGWERGLSGESYEVEFEGFMRQFDIKETTSSSELSIHQNLSELRVSPLEVASAASTASAEASSSSSSATCSSLANETSTTTTMNSNVVTVVGPMTNGPIGMVFNNRYRVEKALGRGSIGPVYLVHDEVENTKQGKLYWLLISPYYIINQCPKQLIPVV